MFIGREEELKQLDQFFSRNGLAALVYGKRRIGKTTLIKRALEDQKKRAVYYECLRGTVKENIEAFTDILRREKILSFDAVFESFPSIFAYLNTLPGEFIIVIDEYPYLKRMTAGESVDSAFQTIIDNYLSNIDLVLSGSHIGMMKDILEEGNALYGRFSCVINLRELDYRTASAFYPSKTAYEKIGFYSFFGGSPFVLSQLQPDKDLKENIIGTILNEHDPVNLYASYLLLSDYSNSANVDRIFSALGNGKKRYSELDAKLGGGKSGNLAKQLGSLLSMEIIAKTEPINRLGDPKKSKYEINDNLMRFYYSYLHKNRSALQMLGPGQFYEEYVAPTLKDFVARRFEEICRDFFAHLARNGRLPGLKNIGSYYYDDPLAKTNGEFDVALDYGDHYAVFEAKYYQKPMTIDEIHKEIGQIRKIKDLNVTEIGFIATNGFQEKEDGYMYYSADDLYR